MTAMTAADTESTTPVVDREGMRVAGRAALGVDLAWEPELDDLRADRSPPRFVLPQVCALALTTGLPLGVLALIGLPIAAGIGAGAGLVSSMAAMLGIGGGIGAAMAPGVARRLDEHGTGHGRVAVIGTLLVAAGLTLVGLVSPIGGMTVAGIGTGLNLVGRTVMLSRGRTRESGMRDLARDRAATQVGVLLAALVIAAVTSASDGLIWVMLVVLAVGTLLIAVNSKEIRRQSVRDGDVVRLRDLVDPSLGDDAETVAEPFRRVMSSQALRTFSPALLAIGTAVGTLHVHLVRFFTADVGLGLWSRGAVYAAVALATAGAVLFAARGDHRRFRDDPSRIVTSARAALIASGILLVAAANVDLPGRVALAMVGFALVAVAATQIDALVLVVVRPALRGHAIAISAIVVLGGGIGIGSLLLAAVARRGSPGAVLATTGVALLLSATTIRKSKPLVATDVDGVVDDEIEASEAVVRFKTGVHAPLLSCSGINFAYGQVQVLFDVDFSVDDGEMVGLLGTNGAGKSTLLRVISGLGTPMNGVVRHEGIDITYLDPAARVDLGITQVPGGKAVFGALSVVDNLRVYGYSLGRDKAAVDRGIEQSFAAFPRLDERRNQLSRVLSGGERQMLALSKALILQPRLLLIDELSLGLAPIIVGQLMTMLRKINERGTAVVLVEQSVNVALSLVNHAYFMEKGEIRFDGVASELRERPDLLRSVYLQGAAEGLS